MLQVLLWWGVCSVFMRKNSSVKGAQGISHLWGYIVNATCPLLSTKITHTTCSALIKAKLCCTALCVCEKERIVAKRSQCNRFRLRFPKATRHSHLLTRWRSALLVPIWSVNDALDKKIEEVGHWEHSKEARARKAGRRRRKGRKMMEEFEND